MVLNKLVPLILGLCLNSIVSIADETEDTSIATSCIGLKDGYHHIKPLEDDIDNDISYPILYVLCSNEYMIIDYSIDPNWSFYFTTFSKYHYGIVGPTRSNHANWREWLLADTTATAHYLISPSCDSCNLDAEYQLHDDETAYYMSALSFGCFSPVRGFPACDFDYDSYECKTCEWDDDNVFLTSSSRSDTLTLEDALDADILTGRCAFEIRSSSQQITESYSLCAIEYNDGLITNWKPSLGIDGRYCMCFKADEDGTSSSYVSVNAQDTNTVLQKAETEEEESVTEFKLYQADFEEGTYRITQSGTYTIMEDIEFDFNAPPKGHSSPNNIDDNFYWATDAAKYPGANDARGPFFLGYFAGITVECDDVEIDLNGFELRMSEMFYYQQPYFSVIELASQAFLPQEGPGFFGADPHFARNIVIQNGVIGLSSHHGIHGNYNENIEIRNVQIKEFQTHGVQFNGFSGLNLKNIEIGPSSARAYLNGNYAQIRLLLPAMAAIALEADDEALTFTGRQNTVTMQDLVDKIVEEMDMILDFVLNGVTYEDNEYWDEAVQMFLNPSGLPMGAVLYGLFLNYPSAGIFGWHVNDARSSDVSIDNLHIHDLRHAGLEIVGFASGGRVFCNGFNGPLPAKDLFGAEQAESFQAALYSQDDVAQYATYVGSIITDIHIAMFYFGRDSFDYWPGIPFLGHNDLMVDWALGNAPHYISSSDSFVFYCNEDAMFHPSKGLLGIKITSVDNVKMSDVFVENLQDETASGQLFCDIGNDGIHGLYHFAQQIPYQVGFSMNMVMGVTVDFSDVVIENELRINNIYSTTGLVYGFAAWFTSNIECLDDCHLMIQNLNAGYSVRDNGLTYDDLPNKAAEVCAFRVYDDETHSFTMNGNAVNEELLINVDQSCIDGQIGCLGDEEQFTFIGSIDDDADCSDNDVLAFDLAASEFSQSKQSKQSILPLHRIHQSSSFKSRLHTHISFFFIFVSIAIAIPIILFLIYVKSTDNLKYQTQSNPSELSRLII